MFYNEQAYKITRCSLSIILFSLREERRSLKRAELMKYLVRCLHRPRESQSGEWLAISSRINTWLFSLFRQSKQLSWNPNRPASPKFNLVFACGYIAKRQHHRTPFCFAVFTGTAKATSELAGRQQISV